MIEQWTGRHAHALRTALRQTNESFADHLGVAPRTVSKWRERPEMTPCAALQQALDAALAGASAEARTRFAANLGEEERPIALDRVSLGELNDAVSGLARLLSRLELAAPDRPSAP